MGNWTRRAFIAAAGAVGGGLLLGVGTVLLAPNPLDIVPSDGKVHLTAWINIRPDNRVLVLVPHCEMGQGAHTGLAMMLAEELDVDWANIEIMEAPAELDYANHPWSHYVDPERPLPDALKRVFHYADFKKAQNAVTMSTGGSSSIRLTGQQVMRKAGAAARTMLLHAAAERWKVPVESCEASFGQVRHSGNGLQATYGELAEAASHQSAPVDPALKSRDQFRIIGKSLPRYDIPQKVDGSATYAGDLKLPDMVYASIMANPFRGGKLLSVDPTPARSQPGFIDVVQLTDAVAVVADSTWNALQGVKRLFPQFDDLGHANVTSETLSSGAKALLASQEGERIYITGKGSQRQDGQGPWLEADYEVPFLAHAPMEPMACVAQFRDGRLEVWAGTQDPLNGRQVAMEALGLRWEDVTFHNLISGGAFGRRLPGFLDYVIQGAHIAKAMSPRPVKLIWSREEDMKQDCFRPAVWAKMGGALDAQKSISAYMVKFTTQDNNYNRTFGSELPYAIPNVEGRHVNYPHHVHVGWWRAVEHTWQTFFSESFIDELAHAAGMDPFQFRRAHLQQNPRYLAVLEKAAEASKWGSPLPQGRARGIAIGEVFGTVVAQVAEVSVSSEKLVKVHRVDAAVDCGYTINPDGAAAQIEGGILFGLTAALLDEVTIQHGKPVQSNFRDYGMLHLAECPEIAVHIVETGAKLGGIGEPPVPAIAPAVANAIFAVTGERIRSLPFKKHGYKVR